MNVSLMFMDTAADRSRNPPWNSKELEKDLDLEAVLNFMAGKDSFIFEVCRTTLLSGLSDRKSILYRQEILKDVLSNPDLIRGLYSITVNAVKEAKKQLFWASRSNPEFVLHESIAVLKIYLGAIEKIRENGRKALPTIHSEGFKQFFGMINEEFSEDYMKSLSVHLTNLTFPRGIFMQGGLGRGNSLTGYTLVVPDTKPEKVLKRITHRREPHYTFTLPDRDENGGRALGEMRARSVAETAEIVSESAGNVLDFINGLKGEIAFYVGCLNLAERLNSIGAKTSFPMPKDRGDSGIRYADLYDLALCLRVKQTVVGNSLEAANDRLIFITGANRGGKSTLLRSIGQAQIMMQCGMFVCAASFSTSIVPMVCTHFKREEDSEMSMGKLDEELNRMNAIVKHIKKGCRLLFNESFSSTNVREGSELARQIIDALILSGIKIIFVTHFNELSEKYLGRKPIPVFLRAERLEDGTRTFRILPADPMPTSFGFDIFKRVFGDN